MKRGSRQFPAKALVTKGGEIYCHLFENRRTGLRRNLYWSITIDFEPIKYGSDEFDCSMTCDWISWPVRDWRELDGKILDVDYGDGGIESSFYMTEHDIGTHTSLKLRRKRSSNFAVTMDMIVDFHGYFGGDQNPKMAVHAEADVRFLGLIVQPSNLSPKPASAAAVGKAVGKFADLGAYCAPEPWRGDGFLFRPLVRRKGRS